MKIFILIAISFLPQFVFSNDEKPKEVKKFNLAISLNYGSYTSGVELLSKPFKNLGIRAGIYNGNLKGTYYTNFAQNSIFVDGNVDLAMVNLFADYYPSKNSTFRITGGFALNQNAYNVRLSPVNSQKFGLIVYSPEKLGNIQISAVGNKIAPYLGIGFGNSVPKYRIGLGLDLGLFYQGGPQFIIIGKGSFEPSGTLKNAETMEKAFRDFAFFPFINFSLRYRIIK